MPSVENGLAVRDPDTEILKDKKWGTPEKRHMDRLIIVQTNCDDIYVAYQFPSESIHYGVSTLQCKQIQRADQLTEPEAIFDHTRTGVMG